MAVEHSETKFASGILGDNKEKSFQIILPFGDALRFVLVSAESDKMQTGHHKKSYSTLLLTASAKGGRQ